MCVTYIDLGFFLGILDRTCESPKRRAHLWVAFSGFIKETCKHGIFWHISRPTKVGLFSLSHAHESMTFFDVLDCTCKSPKIMADLWVTFTSFIKETCKHCLFWHI